MRKILLIFFIPSLIYAWDFTQERITIPVYFDSVVCQVPWGTGYNYIHPTFNDIDGDNDYDLVFGSDWKRISYLRNTGNQNLALLEFITDTLVNIPAPTIESQTSNVH